MHRYWHCVFWILIVLAESAEALDGRGFVKDSFARFRVEPSQLAVIYDNGLANQTRLTDLEALLYGAYSLHTSDQQALARFAQLLSISERQARDYRRALFDLVELRKNCSQYNQRSPCQTDAAVLARIERLANSTHGDRYLLAAAKNLDGSDYHSFIIGQIETLENARAVLLDLYQYSRSDVYLKSLMKTPFKNDQVYDVILETTPKGLNQWYQLALKKNVLEELISTQNSLKFKAYNRFLTDLLAVGLTAKEAQETITNKPFKKEMDDYQSIIEANPNNKKLPLLLSASLLQQKQFDHAEKLLSQYGDPISSDMEIKILTDFLSEYIHRQLAFEDIYYFYLEGITQKESIRRYIAQKNNRLLFFDTASAWRNIIGLSPITDRLLADYLYRQGYREIAKSIARQNAVQPTFEPLDNSLDRHELTDLARVFFNRARYKAFTSMGTSQVELAEQRSEWLSSLDWIHPISPEVRQPNQALRDPPLPDNLPLPVHHSQIVRQYFDRKDWYILYLSSAVDPSGQVAGGGYWMQKTMDGGHFWGPSVYLGLQQYAPYNISATGALPMVSGDRIRLQADVHQLPSVTSADSQIDASAYLIESQVQLEFSWREVSRDRDQDGLTDILEQFIGTHPLHPDTDFDGMPDKDDSLPLETFVKSAEQYSPVAMALLDRLIGYQLQSVKDSSGARIAAMDAQAVTEEYLHEQHTLFIQAPAKYFQGIQPPIRLIFIDQHEVKTQQNRAAFFPLSLETFFTNADATDFYVVWNTGWTGGSFRIRIIDGEVEVENLGHWIGKAD